ncbi:uncharacterized protein CXorf58 homolog [Phoenicopterus ruber ruber]
MHAVLSDLVLSGRRVSEITSTKLLSVHSLLLCFFTFARQEFPPFVVLKIFRSTQGQGSKYISGKRIISPSNEAAADACKLMGYQKYHEQMVQDELQYPNDRITGDNDVLLRIWRRTIQIYSRSCRCIVLLQSTSNLDESPGYFDGRNNCWRRLALQNFPGTTIIHATTDHAQSKTLSDRLKKELKFLLLRPQHKELWHDRLLAVSNVRAYTKFQFYFACQYFSLSLVTGFSKYL